MNKEELIKKINKLRKQRGALILAHNYQISDIQDLADFVGDSLDLSRKAAAARNKLIIFCGVHFMAESAAIFSPEKTVLIPDLEAGCSLAASIDASELARWKKRYPKAVVLAYVNTTAEVKAEADYCCTSTNSVKIVNSIPKDKQILFVPDMFLADYVARITKRDIIAYPGECHVHAKVKPADVNKKMKEYPRAEFLIHPECGCATACMHYVATGDIKGANTYIYSTGGMVKHARKSKAKEFIIATETGLIHRLKKENPQKKFIALRDDMVCQYMKKITLKKLYLSLKDMVYEVKVPEKIAKRARVPIEKMLKLSS